MGGKRLATASADETVPTYALDIRELLDLARSRVTRTPRSFTPEECTRYDGGTGILGRIACADIAPSCLPSL